MIHKFTIQRGSDDGFSVLLNDNEIGSFNHDRDGWAGMEAAETLIRNIAGVLDIEVSECYVEDSDDY